MESPPALAHLAISILASSDSKSTRELSHRPQPSTPAVDRRVCPASPTSPPAVASAPASSKNCISAVDRCVLVDVSPAVASAQPRRRLPAVTFFLDFSFWEMEWQ
nr:hypothetical protein Iba_chr06dCG10270 [Ipomoea batatas]